MNLFEIDKQIEDCIDLETGEVLDVEKLDALNMERSTKIENIACWIKNLNAEAKALEEQEKAFCERKKQAKRKADSLKEYLSKALNGEKFKTDKCVVSFRRSEALSITNEELVPQEFITEEVTRKVNKDAIKALIKSGASMAGCELVERVNAIIK